jgi:hypothetical protein
MLMEQIGEIKVGQLSVSGSSVACSNTVAAPLNVLSRLACISETSPLEVDVKAPGAFV